MVYSHQNLKTIMDKVFKKYSDNTAMDYLKDNGVIETYSFSDIENIIYKAKETIFSCGLTAGDRVAVITPHSPFGVMAGLALVYLNITVVLIDASLPDEEIFRLLEFSDVRAVFTVKNIYDKIPAGLIENIPCFELGKDNAINKFIDGSIKTVSKAETSDRDTDVAAIIFSSGTTDKMKGIMVTYHSVVRAWGINAELAGIKENMTYLLVLPFNHISGFTSAITYFLTGCKIDFIENVNASKLADGLQKFQPNYFVMIPKVYEVMEQKIRAQLHNKGKSAEILIYSVMKLSGFLRKNFGINIGRKLLNKVTSAVFGQNIYNIGTGASPCKPSTSEFYLNLGLEWANFYATTETNVPIAATGIFDRYPSGNVGNINRHKGIEICIGKPDKNGIGEILVKTDLIMKGYFRESELTKAAFENGYFKTGDYGYIDKKGFLHLTGRIKESIVLKNGKKVSPSDVDNYYINIFPKYDMASCGVLNAEEDCDEIHMFIKENKYDLKLKKKICSDIMTESKKAPSMYQISEIHFVSDFPKTSVGKVKRFELVKLAESQCQSTSQIKKSDDTEELEMTDYVINRIRAVDKNIDKVSVKSRLKEDLGLNSLTMFDLCIQLETKFEVSIAGKLGNAHTVGDLIELIKNNDGDKPVMNYNINDYPKIKTKKDIKRLNLLGSFSKKIYKFKSDGIENILTDKNYIFCPNHESHFDALWVWTAIATKIDLNKICCLAKQEHLESRITRAGLAMSGGIPIDRSGNPTPAMERGLKCLIAGKYNMLIHPEGTRTRNGKLGDFKSGAAKLSIKSGVEIIPVCILGSYDIFPPHKKLPRLFDWKHFRKYPLYIKFGKPIAPDNQNAEELTKQIRKQIVEMKNNFEKERNL